MPRRLSRRAPRDSTEIRAGETLVHGQAIRDPVDPGFGAESRGTITLNLFGRGPMVHAEQRPIEQVMKGKNIIRVLVLAGIFAWPAIETYRLRVARQQVVEAKALENSVQQKLAQLKNVELATKSETPAKPQ